MSTKLLTATEVARNFSDVLDEIAHHGASYDIRRGRDIVARLTPPRATPRGITVSELAELVKRLPALEAGDGARFEKDLAASRKRLRPPRDPWA